MSTYLTQILATLTLLSHVMYVIGLILFFTNTDFRGWLVGFVNKRVLSLLFVTTLSAMVGSLLYSNVIGFPPCELCWIQRIFMYPQVLLSFLALRKGDKTMVSYLLPMTVLGAVVALYHSGTHYGLGDGLVGCTSALGDCGKLYVFEYNYITIPLMSFTMFVYLLTISLIYFRSRNDRI